MSYGIDKKGLFIQYADYGGMDPVYDKYRPSDNAEYIFMSVNLIDPK